MGRDLVGIPPWYEFIVEKSVRPAYLVPLVGLVAAWATLDLSLNPPLRVKWFIQRKKRPVFVLPPGASEIPLSEEEAQNLYFNMTAEADLWGKTLRNNRGWVFLRAHRVPKFTVMVLLHEARHVWQFARGLYLKTEDERDRTKADGDADWYAIRAMDRKISSLVDKELARQK